MRYDAMGQKEKNTKAVYVITSDAITQRGGGTYDAGGGFHDNSFRVGFVTGHLFYNGDIEKRMLIFLYTLYIVFAFPHGAETHNYLRNP